MKRTKTKILSVFLSVCMIISCMVGMSVTAGAVVSPSVSKATSALSGNGNVTAGNFYQDFVEVTEEEAKAWTGAPAGNTSILLYKIDGSTLFQVIFVNGNYTDSTSTNMTISDWNMTYGNIDVYYTTGSGSSSTVAWTNGNVIATLNGTKLTVEKKPDTDGAMGDSGWAKVGSAGPWNDIKDDITEIEIQDGVTSISNYAFSGFSAITSIDIPSSVKSIGEAAFDYCTSLTSVTIPGSVTSIGNNAFSDCIDLTSVTFIPGTAGATLSIGRYAFYNTANGAKVAYGTGDTVLYDDETKITTDTLLTDIQEKTLTWKASSSTVAVTDVSLAPTTANLTVGGDAVALTATVTPDNATDKKVKWSVSGDNSGEVKLYSDANCTAGNEIGTDATETLTVYAKGISAGSSTVTVTSNADSTKSATCTVTVKTTPAAPTTVTANHCTTKANNDGKLIGVTTDMEYKKSDDENWTAGTGSDITGLVPGTYYVRLKETETTNASGNQTLTIKPVEKTDPFVGRIYDIGDEIYFGLNEYTYIVIFDNNEYKVWVYDSNTLRYRYGEEYKYTVTTPQYYANYGGQWLFPNALIVRYTTGTEYTPLLLGHGYTDGGEIVTGIECTGGNGTSENPYTFKVVFKPRVEGSAEGYSGEYDGSSHGITVSVDDPDSGTTIKYGTSSGNYDLDTCPEYTDPGSYTVYYEVKADNRSALRGSADVIITKKTPTADNFTFTAPTDTVYSGDAKAADVAAKQGVTGMGEVTVKYFSDEARTTEAEPDDAGTYYVGITVAEGDINVATADNTVLYNAAWTFEITKAAPTVTAPTANTLTYNGAAQALVTGGSATGGTMQYSLDGVTYSADIPTATAAGTYTVYFKVVGDKNHKDTEAKTVTAAIAPRVNPTPYIPSYSPSNTSTTTTTTTTVNAPAETMTFEGEETISHTNLLSWSSVSGASSYLISVKTDGKFVPLATTTKTNIDVVHAYNGKYYVSEGGKYTAYTYKDGKFVKGGTITAAQADKLVKANNVTDTYMLQYMKNGKLSSDKTALTVSIKVYYKPAVKASSKDGAVILKWNKVEGAEKYRIYKYTNSKLTKIADTTANAVRLKNVTEGKTYKYAVKAYVDGKWTKVYKSDIVSVTAK